MAVSAASSRSLLFQLLRSVSSCLGVQHCPSPSPSTCPQRALAAATSPGAAHDDDDGDGDDIVATRLPRELDLAEKELLAAGKRRAASSPSNTPGRPGNPAERPGKGKHNGATTEDDKTEEGEQGRRNAASGRKVLAGLAAVSLLDVRRPKPPGPDPREGCCGTMPPLIVTISP